MDDGRVLILKGDDVSALLQGREVEIVDAVRRAYVAHAKGQSFLPHSSFLRFPGDELNRIIALPAFLGDGFDIAGIKWISSFPGNVRQGMARASAVLIVNSCSTGHVEAILESSLISVKRTAASAALAAQVLLGGGAPAAVGLVGLGVINLEIARFLGALLPGIARCVLFDLDPERGRRFAARLRELAPAIATETAPDLATVLARCPLVSFATTAVKPHVEDLSACPPGAVILHVSLRDIAASAILACDNVVDDADHVCRAQTSLHLAEQQTSSRDFIRCSLADLCLGRQPARVDDSTVTVFSPFGLGVLDLAVARLVLDRRGESGRGTAIESFLPTGEGVV